MSFPHTHRRADGPDAYPPPRYHGTDGEVSALFRSHEAPPEFTSAPLSSEGPEPPRGTAYHYLATTASTGGDFGLYRVDMAAGGRGPASHFHRAMSESFVVLEGTLSLFDGAHWRAGTPGDFLFVPPGDIHAFENRSGAPLSMLMLFAPGAPREGYFENLAHLADLTQPEREAFLIEHDSFFV